MTDLCQLKDDLVTANKILADHHVVDSFGHVSVRHPDNPAHFLMSRARAPDCVEIGDIMEFTNHEGNVVGPEPGKPYSERFIHAAIFDARPDVMCVVHNHSPNVVPFTVQNKRRMKPIMHMCAPIGTDIPTWDIAHKFGTTNLLVTNIDMGRDLAAALGPRSVALMRGHGSVVVGSSLRSTVFTSVYMEINAEMLLKAYALAGDDITPLSDGEVNANASARAGFTLERGWENWCRRVGRPYYAMDWNMGPGFSKTDK
ncbi:MAG TPA: class II aldolase/adducin family protein [Beijerinckiaceae bacterium]|jgi:HCOMODA/2-hydroxy-3-carboxy-muconic semialdehyde decarboxylase|nr:class II aldolase/adducin family protein [Beijerinckiaceae bacterium]